ncbi:SIR2 family protein [Streptomyces sp. NPDC051572]|uniref:SIR2 family protein n=1 Tax=Streptomyces sp. NPDC051572 TaxID=3155802 RepID=UPI00344F2818
MEADGTAPEHPAQAPLVVAPGRILDAKTALALNVHASPGVYALLLGSGISLTSGVQTGWGIVEDLVGRVAAMQDPNDTDAAEKAAADPAGWWAQHYDGDLGYSSLLGAVAPTAAARQQQLARYFQPQEDDEPGAKGPTPAHHAIAQLVKRGSVRVILTTNFDRLTERALEEAGIPPQIISRPSQIAEMMPLPHAPVTVIKLHGDYAALDQLNTVDELEAYEPEQQELLQRVLDEYGLIICGWSADWDTALVRALEGVRPRRYPMFWSSYSALGEAAKHLTTQHSGVVIEGMAADDLFTDLQRRIEALDLMAAPPVTRDIAVTRLKRALPDPVRRIEASDLIHQTVTGILDRTAAAARPLSGPVFDESVRGYRADCDILLHLLAHGVFNDDGTHDALWLRAVERLTRIRSTFSGAFIEALEALRHYPALLATWTMGVTAVISRREELLATIMAQPTWNTLSGRTRTQPPAVYLNPMRVLATDLKSVMPPAEGRIWRFPQSRFLRQETREPLRVLEPDDTAYQTACTRFEFLTSMIAMDDEAENMRFPWVGHFIDDTHWEYDTSMANTIKTELTPNWPLLRAGAFGGDMERAQAAYERLVEWRAKTRFNWL